MMHQSDPIPPAEAAWEREDDRRQAEDRAEHAELMSDMLDALLTDPRRVVATPAYQTSTRYTAAYEALSEITEERALQVCQLLAACDRGDWRTASVLSKAILSGIAQQYADTHVGARPMPFGPMPTVPSIRRTA